MDCLAHIVSYLVHTKLFSTYTELFGTVARGSVVAPFKMFRPVVIHVYI